MTALFTQDQISSIVLDKKNLTSWYNALITVLPQYDISTAKRVAAFLAQTAHESGGYRTLKENLNYRAVTLRKVFPKYFPTDEIAEQFAGKADAIANKVYANRMGNGDEASGDGYRYCGHGLIQLTGKSNFQAFAKSINMPLEKTADYLLTFEGAVKAACWFWQINKLNQYADSGDINTMTQRINGGLNGIDDRTKLYEQACNSLGV
jgi:putative chitinase